MNTLSEVSIGNRVRISAIDGDDAISIRLMEMGLLPGIEILLIGSAPLGDPIEIELRGYRLSLRRSEAARVEVEST